MRSFSAELTTSARPDYSSPPALAPDHLVRRAPGPGIREHLFDEAMLPAEAACLPAVPPPPCGSLLRGDVYELATDHIKEAIVKLVKEVGRPRVAGVTPAIRDRGNLDRWLAGANGHKVVREPIEGAEAHQQRDCAGLMRSRPARPNRGRAP